MQISYSIGRYTCKIIMLVFFFLFVLFIFPPFPDGLCFTNEEGAKSFYMWPQQHFCTFLPYRKSTFSSNISFFKRGFLKPRDKVCALVLSIYKLLNSYHNSLWAGDLDYINKLMQIFSKVPAVLE